MVAAFKHSPIGSRPCAMIFAATWRWQELVLPNVIIQQIRKYKTIGLLGISGLIKSTHQPSDFGLDFRENAVGKIFWLSADLLCLTFPENVHFCSIMLVIAHQQIANFKQSKLTSVVRNTKWVQFSGRTRLNKGTKNIPIVICQIFARMKTVVRAECWKVKRLQRSANNCILCISHYMHWQKCHAQNQ